MALLMIDLDNTLVDRDAAFRAAAGAFLAERALPATDVEWVMSVDANGYAPRPEVARAMAERYGAALPQSAVRAFLDRGSADRVVLSEAVRDALAKAVAGGWSCVIVTNGCTRQQEAKIRRTGLDALVHGWVVSEAVGHKKPDPRIFLAAAETIGASFDGAWVIGDSAHADIAGAHRLGVRSVWVADGRPWPAADYRPTRIAADTASAITGVIESAVGP
ncbi:HAD family hydrolase [Streptomyces sp. NPDC014894]|uniref:HAD family hydrolase n=1 Tax=unclassified Streptomyces TaxID=2593676 RepID=UPI0036FF4162